MAFVQENICVLQCQIGVLEQNSECENIEICTWNIAADVAGSLCRPHSLTSSEDDMLMSDMLSTNVLLKQDRLHK